MELIEEREWGLTVQSTSSLRCPLLVPRQCQVHRKAQPLAAFLACFPSEPIIGSHYSRQGLNILFPEHTTQQHPGGALRGAVRPSRLSTSQGRTALLKRLALGEF